MRKILPLILTFWVSFSCAQDPQLEKHWWVPNGPVTVIEHDTLSNRVYLGGEFTSVAAQLDYNAFIGRFDGQPDLRFPKISAQPPFWQNINASVPDGFGGWFIGGYFGQVGDSMRQRIAHINSTGEVSGKFAGNGLDGAIFDMILSNDTLFVSGEFTGFGNVRKNIGRSDKSTGEISSDFPLFDGTYIFDIISDNTGGWFISGNFSMAGDSSRNGLVQIDSSYQVTAWNPDVDGEVYSMEISGGILYVGGYFSSIGGQVRENLAAINPVTGMPVSFAPSVSGSIAKISLNNNAVYFVGDFSYVNGTSNAFFACVDKLTGLTIPESIYLSNYGFYFGNCDLLMHNDTLYVGGYFNSGFQNNLIAINTANNTQLSWYPQVDSTVCALEWYNGNLIAGGDMSQGVCRIDPVTGLITSVGNAQGPARSLHVAGDTLYIGGFHYAPGHCVSATNLVTNQPLDWDPLITGVAYSIHSNNSDIIVGGYVQAVEGTKRYKLASFDAVTGNLTSWNPPKMNNGVNPLFAMDDKIYVGGNFAIFGDSLRNMIVELDRYQGNVTSWRGPALNGYYSGIVRDLYADSTSIVAGGNFGYLQNGITKQDLVIINRNSGAIQPWNISANDYGINTMHMAGDLLYVAGHFDTIAGQHISYAAAFNPTNGIIQPLNLHANKQVTELSHFGNILYLGGVFDTINGIRRNGLCAYDIAADAVDSWNPDPEASYPNIYHLNADAYRVVVSGAFSSIGGIKRKNFVALDGLSGKPTSFAPNPDREVTSIAYTNDALYMGGRFDTIAGVTRNFIACFDKNGGTLDSWDPGLGIGAAVNDLLVSDGKLYVGGTFGTISGQIRRSIAAYELPGHTLSPLSCTIYQHIRDLEKRNDTIYMAGFLDTIPGSNIGVLSVNETTGQWNQLNDALHFDDYVNSISLAGDKLILGGEFDDLDTNSRNHLAAFNINPGGLSEWDPFYTIYSLGYQKAIKATAVYDSIVLVGGDFSFPGNSVNDARSGFAAIGISSGIVTPWKPVIGDIDDLKISGSRLFVGGAFGGGSSTTYKRPYFLTLKLKPGPGLKQLADINSCSVDTIGPLSFDISDPINVNTVQLAGYSSDTTIVSSANVIISGSGSNRDVLVILNPGVSGTVTVTIVATNQEGVSTNMHFNIHQTQAQVQISGATSICTGDTITIGAGSGYTNYLWNTGSTSSSIVTSQGGAYAVTVIDAYGCTATDSVTINIHPIPVVALSATPGLNICLGDSTLISATPGYPGYQWLKNNAIIPGAITNIYYANFTSGIRCTVTDTNSCKNTSNTARVRVVCLPPGPNHQKITMSDASETELIVTVQPNPSTGDFNILTNCGFNGEFNVDVFDASSRLVNQGSAVLKGESSNFIIPKMQPGIYIARIRCDHGEKLIKIVQTK